MVTGLPPVAGGREPAWTGTVVIAVPAGSRSAKNRNGSLATLYRTLSPPPQYSYVSSHRLSAVGTTFVIPGRPPPISVLPSTVCVRPATSTTGALHAAAPPVQVR